jgi:hypothetical protein
MRRLAAQHDPSRYTAGISIIDWKKITAASKADTDLCRVSSVLDQPLGSAEVTKNCATFSVLALSLPTHRCRPP